MSKSQEKGGTVEGGGRSSRRTSGMGNSGWKGQEGSDVPGTLKTGIKPHYPPYDGTLCNEKPSRQNEATRQIGTFRKNSDGRFGANETAGIGVKGDAKDNMRG